MGNALRKRAIPQIAGVTQLVECDLAKVDVAGSNPVSRSILSRGPFETAKSARPVPKSDTPGPSPVSGGGAKFMLLVRLLG